MTFMRKTILLVSIALLLGPLSLAQKPNKVAAQTPPPPSFLNIATIGDSLSQGQRNGVLNPTYQAESYTALIGRQVRTFQFLPLINGANVTLIAPGIPPVVDVEIDPEAGQRVFPLIVPQNLAVGGANVLDALASRPTATSIDELIAKCVDQGLGACLIDLTLGLPLALQGVQVSQVELAVGLQPTFTIVWIGSNDVLGAVTQADPSLITPFPVFTAAYTQVVGALLTLTNSQVIVGNIPDVTTIAFLFTAEEVAGLAGAPLPIIGPILGIEAGDFVTLPGLELVEPILTGQAPGPLPANVVLTAEETQIAQTAVLQMNAFIGGVAAQLGLPVADVNAFLQEADMNGIQVGPFNLNTDFFGGIFSLDGVHPTATAQGLTANLFIQKINEFWQIPDVAQIPPVDVESIAAGDDLVLKAPPAGAISLGSFDENHFDMGGRVRDLLRPKPGKFRPTKGAKFEDD